MFGQILAIAAALGLTYGLLRLRQFILTYGKSHRTFVRVHLRPPQGGGGESSLEEWPREIEIAPPIPAAASALSHASGPK